MLCDDYKAKSKYKSLQEIKFIASKNLKLDEMLWKLKEKEDENNFLKN